MICCSLKGRGFAPAFLSFDMRQSILVKKDIFLLLTGLLLFLSIQHPAAQNFYRFGNMSLDPALVIPENYWPIKLSGQTPVGYQINVFSRKNPYTFLQLISDERKSVYHILYQTTFTGELLYIGCSNNLYGLFSKKEKPLVLFNNCMNEAMEEMASMRIIDRVVDCILSRLAYCMR